MDALREVGRPGVPGDVEGGAEDDAEDEDGVEDVGHAEGRSGTVLGKCRRRQ